jgi:hypothetical protein
MAEVCHCARISHRNAIRVSNRQFECSSTVLGEISNSKGSAAAGERGSVPMKADDFTEIFLWNQNVDRLVCVLQRLESFSIHPKQVLKAYEVRLEEIRAGLNADFSEAMAARECADESRLWRQRTALEKQTETAN